MHALPVAGLSLARRAPAREDSSTSRHCHLAIGVTPTATWLMPITTTSVNWHGPVSTAARSVKVFRKRRFLGRRPRASASPPGDVAQHRLATGEPAVLTRDPRGVGAVPRELRRSAQPFGGLNQVQSAPRSRYESGARRQEGIS